jgi:hypothetical protein
MDGKLDGIMLKIMEGITVGGIDWAIVMIGKSHFRLVPISEFSSYDTPPVKGVIPYSKYILRIISGLGPSL